MPTCVLCHGTEFEMQDGFFYCVECQTQTQEIQELSYEYRAGDERPKVLPKRRKKKVKEKPIVQGVKWTSWEAYNVILRGLTQELLAIGAPAELEMKILQIWACHLSVAQIAFLKSSRSNRPKLNCRFRSRDGQIIHGLDLARRQYKYLRRLTKKNLHMMNSQIRAKRQMHLSHYENHLSTSQASNTSFENDTLECLGKSTAESSDIDEPRQLNLPKRRHMTQNGYMWYRKYTKKRDNKWSTHYFLREQVHRQTLIAIIFIALRLIRSDIFMSDIMRFIREGSLSYSHVSQFLPEDFVFGQGDMIFSSTSVRMLTIPSMNAALVHEAMHLGIKSYPTPDLTALIKRYVNEFLLPKQLADVAIQFYLLTWKHKPVTSISQSGHHSLHEAVAAAYILFTCKLLFGLDGITEYKISKLADAINNVASEDKSFAFDKWQCIIELRNAVLCKYHPPFREQLRTEGCLDLSDTLKMYMDSFGDTSLKQRILYRANSTHHKHTTKAMENLTNYVISREQEEKNLPKPSFTPSLTPYQSHMEAILKFAKENETTEPPWVKYLTENDWTKSKIDFLINRNSNLDKLKTQKIEKCDLIMNIGRQETLESNDLISYKKTRKKILESEYDVELDTVNTECQRIFKDEKLKSPLKINREEHLSIIDDISCDFSGYWQLQHNEKVRFQMWQTNFQELFMEKFPQNFAWLLNEFSIMLHLPPPHIYRELLRVENAIIDFL